MQRVFVISKNKQPLMPCTPARARKLLNKGEAAVYRRYPFTIILKEREGGDTQPIAFKIDPGSKTTGIALVAGFKRGKRLVWAGELSHRGQQIKDGLEARRAIRRNRRARHTRYRPARFNNRRRPEGWLPPSVQSRVDNIVTWASCLSKFALLTSVSLELVKFDTQAMQNPEISGVEYQQGKLMGYEVREYLLEKLGRRCAYCNATGIPLEVEHIVPKSRGGSNRVSNLTLSCRDCNQKKGNRTAAEFGHPDVQSKAKQPLKDTAAVNASRWKLYEIFKQAGLPLEVGTGGRTKYNCVSQGYPKTHWLDATCVGESGECVFVHSDHAPLLIKAMGHGSRQMCRTDKYGFPSRHCLRQKRYFGFQTGDIVQASIVTGKYAGNYTGRVACRATGSFDIKTESGKITTKHSNCVVLHHSDGYTYTKGERCFPPHA